MYAKVVHVQFSTYIVNESKSELSVRECSTHGRIEKTESTRFNLNTLQEESIYLIKTYIGRC